MLDLKIVHHFQHVKQINDFFTDEADHIYSTMPMYKLIEYNHNYMDKFGSLWKFKRDKVPNNNDDLTTDVSKSFK